MKLVIPTNWESDLIERLDLPCVESVFGKLERDFVGGGRPSCVLNGVSRRQMAGHVRRIHEKGMQFYYLLNSSCLGNFEWTRSGQARIEKLLGWLSGISVDGLVVASPYLAQYALKNYPHFKISVSCFAGVNSVEKARFWESLGVSVITLPQTELNRSFRLLEKIRKAVRCGLQLIVNDNCLLDCPWFFYHNNVTSHASQSGRFTGTFMFDYCRLNCRSSMVAEPEKFLRAAWIRPEDLSVYEGVGIDRFKLVDRTMCTDALLKIVNAYAARRYDGNLQDLFNDPSKSQWLKHPNILHKLKFILHPFSINLFRLLKHRHVVSDMQVYIDNNALDGFITHFLDRDCRYESCAECGYCRQAAKKAVRIDPAYQDRAGRQYRNFIDEVISGDIFRYWGRRGISGNKLPER